MARLSGFDVIIILLIILLPVGNHGSLIGIQLILGGWWCRRNMIMTGVLYVEELRLLFITDEFKSKENANTKNRIMDHNPASHSFLSLSLLRSPSSGPTECK